MLASHPLVWCLDALLASEVGSFSFAFSKGIDYSASFGSGASLSS